MPPSYEPLVAPARARSELWRTVFGAAAAIALYILWMLGMGLVFALIDGLAGLERRLSGMGTGSDPWSVILLLSTFLGGWFGVWAVIRVLHRRSLGSLLGRAPRVLRDFVLGVAIMAVISAISAVIGLSFLPPLELAMEPGLWLTFLPLALFFVLVQTGAEELFFRGYLQSQLAARFASPLAWLILPSVLFGLAHYSGEQPPQVLWMVVAATGLFGLIAADLTARSGSLGLAWGLHFANNVLAILVISLMGGFDGLALFHVAGGAQAALVPLLAGDMVLMITVWALCRLQLRAR